MVTSSTVVAATGSSNRRRHRQSVGASPVTSAVRPANGPVAARTAANASGPAGAHRRAGAGDECVMPTPQSVAWWRNSGLVLLLLAVSPAGRRHTRHLLTLAYRAEAARPPLGAGVERRAAIPMAAPPANAYHRDRWLVAFAGASWNDGDASSYSGNRLAACRRLPR